MQPVERFVPGGLFERLRARRACRAAGPSSRAAAARPSTRARHRARGQPRDRTPAGLALPPARVTARSIVYVGATRPFHLDARRLVRADRDRDHARGRRARRGSRRLRLPARGARPRTRGSCARAAADARAFRSITNVDVRRPRCRGSPATTRRRRPRRRNRGRTGANNVPRTTRSPNGPRERRQPAERALPAIGASAKLNSLSPMRSRGRSKRRTLRLRRSPGAPANSMADRVPRWSNPTANNDAVGGVDTGKREPMIPRDLPRHSWRWTQRHVLRGYVSGVARTMTKVPMIVNDA